MARAAKIPILLLAVFSVRGPCRRGNGHQKTFVTFLHGSPRGQPESHFFGPPRPRTRRGRWQAFTARRQRNQLKFPISPVIVPVNFGRRLMWPITGHFKIVSVLPRRGSAMGRFRWFTWFFKFRISLFSCFHPCFRYWFLFVLKFRVTRLRLNGPWCHGKWTRLTLISGVSFWFTG